MSYEPKVNVPDAAVTLLDIPDTEPGYTRRHDENGDTVYLDSNGSVVRDEDLVERFDELTIPPAWQEVWICANESGYLQSTGRDEQGRKQYIYHPFWHEYQAAHKYAEVLRFGESLPSLRARVDRDLRRRALTRERVRALGIAVLDHTAMRVGHDMYTTQHGSHGLTTLYKEHCSVFSTKVEFCYPGKSGVAREVSLRDRRLSRQLAKLLDLPGQYLWQYVDGDTRRLHADDLNHYLCDATECEDWSVKYFRTWSGSVRALDYLLAIDPPDEETLGASELYESWSAPHLTGLVEAAASFLGNTRAVCRDYYIHRDLLTSVQEGTFWETIPPLLSSWETRHDRVKEQRREEWILLELLRTS